jgi:urease accessory protein UreF
MTPGCITQRLQMETKTYLSHWLYGQGREVVSQCMKLSPL